MFLNKYVCNLTYLVNLNFSKQRMHRKYQLQEQSPWWHHSALSERLQQETETSHKQQNNFFWLCFKTFDPFFKFSNGWLLQNQITKLCIMHFKNIDHLLTLQFPTPLAAAEAWYRDATLLLSTSFVIVLQISCRNKETSVEIQIYINKSQSLELEL